MKKSLGGGLGFPFLLNWPQTEFSLFLLEKGERNVTLRVWGAQGGSMLVDVCGCDPLSQV